MDTKADHEDLLKREKLANRRFKSATDNDTKKPLGCSKCGEVGHLSFTCMNDRAIKPIDKPRDNKRETMALKEKIEMLRHKKIEKKG